MVAQLSSAVRRVFLGREVEGELSRKEALAASGEFCAIAQSHKLVK